MSDEASNLEPTRSKKWLRVLHIYISLYSFVLVLFFGVTGFMMNHPDWFGMETVSTESKEIRINAELISGGNQLAIVEHLRAAAHLRGLVQSYEVAANEIRIGFASAGRRADVLIDRQSGETRIDLETSGMAALFSAIHSGENTGRFGRRVIDIAAIFLVLTSLTGLFLWFTLTIRRPTGIIWLIASLGLMAVIFLVLIR